jgi:rhodanese-related sulfurtransferase
VRHVLWCCGLLASALVNAAGSGDPIENTLRDIPPAGLACRRDDVLSAAVESARRSGAPDLNCAMSAAELQARRSAGALHVIDTRTASEYAQLHIDAALNLSAGDVGARAYLHRQPIVLVGSGKGDRALYIACDELKQAGATSVQVLRGGMNSWRAAGLPVVGDARTAGNAIELDDEELMEELEFTANLILAMPRARAFTSLTPRAMLLETDSGAGLRAMLSERAKQVGAPALASVVLLTGGPRRAAELDELRRAVEPHPLLTYERSAQEYSAFVRSKKAVWAAQARGPKTLPCSTR